MGDNCTEGLSCVDRHFGLVVNVCFQQSAKATLVHSVLCHVNVRMVQHVTLHLVIAHANLDTLEQTARFKSNVLQDTV